MYTSSDKAKVGLVKYITGVNLLEEKQSNDALYNASNAFLQKFHGNSSGTSQQVIDKYTLIHAYDVGGIVSFSDLEKIISDTLVVENFNDTVSGVTNKQRLINVLTAHKSSIVFNQNSIDAIDLLVAHINHCDSDTLPKYAHNKIVNLFSERKAFYAMVTERNNFV